MTPRPAPGWSPYDLDAIPVPQEDTRPFGTRLWDFLKGGGPWGTAQPGQRGTFVPSKINEQGQPEFAFPGIVSQPAESLHSLMTAPLSDIVRSGDRDAMRAASEASFDVSSMLPAAGVAAGRTMPTNAAGMGGGKLDPPLPMDKASRMVRAQEMGFDTDQVAYRGLSKPYDETNTGYYQMFTSSPAEAGEYAMQNPLARPNVVSAYLRKGNNLEVDAMGRNFNSIPTGNLPDPIKARLRSVARTDEIAHAARELGYDSATIKNVIDNATNEVIPPARTNPQMEAKRAAELDAILAELEGIDEAAAATPNAQPREVGYQGVQPHERGPVTIDAIFDPSNIRSVNAAFDPAKKNSANLLASNPDDLNTSAVLAAMTGQERPGNMTRALDDLGYYSQALEAAKSWPQAKGTAEQAITWLKKSGVKDAEIDATGLRGFLEGKKSVTQDEIAAFLDQNRVKLREVVTSDDRTKWSAYSLDPSNPTYRETVLHLPTDAQRPSFHSGHFPEPNIIGHTMASMVKHDGKPVYLIDQIQSDWGQKIRDGGVRDAAKIAELQAKLKQIGGPAIDLTDSPAWWAADDFLSRIGYAKPSTLHYSEIPQALQRAYDAPMFKEEDAATASALYRSIQDEIAQRRLLEAELETAAAATPGNPLVNTTDQWVNTTLRRALMQAAETDAAGVAIPSGKTVLSYNPGDDHGMGVFYDKIVPKNLGNILNKVDQTIARQYVEQLETPTEGMAGSGFSYFPITDAAKAEIRKGLPLFSNPDDPMTAAILALLTQQQGQQQQ